MRSDFRETGDRNMLQLRYRPDKTSPFRSLHTQSWLRFYSQRQGNGNIAVPVKTTTELRIRHFRQATLHSLSPITWSIYAPITTINPRCIFTTQNPKNSNC